MALELNRSRTARVDLHRGMTTREQTFPVSWYNLAATLTSGQAFRWRRLGESWEGVIGSRWVRLLAEANAIRATALREVQDWTWLVDYLQLEVNLAGVLAAFPNEEPLRRAVFACHGLRLLRQDAWECLASFILSSTKQIVQIRQVVDRLCRRFGEPIVVPDGVPDQWSFPEAGRLATVSERELRECGMGFRAPYLLGSARMIARGEVPLNRLGAIPLAEARAELMRLPGVGRKIADCVLLFAVGQATAFPIDVWILKTLRRFYFSGRVVPMKKLIEFAESHFGPQAGYAQQYLFHFARSQAGRVDG